MTGSMGPKSPSASRHRGGWARNARRVGVLSAAALILSSCGWRGIANVPLPGGPGTVDGHSTIYIQMPETLGLNANSRVRVADVFVGRVRAIELKNWVPTLTVDLNPGINLPRNVQAKIGQTSLLGTQHLELDPPADPSSQPLRNGDTIELKNSSAYPTIERTLAAVGGSTAKAAEVLDMSRRTLQYRMKQWREGGAEPDDPAEDDEE